ncbi:MAG: phage holin family protein [Actinomycetota bacterium]
MSILWRVVLNAAAAWVTVWAVPGLNYDVGDQWWRWLIFGAVIGLINAVIKPIVKLLALPVRILTLGLFTLVINIALMALAIWIAESTDVGLSADSGWAVVLGGLVLTIAVSVFQAFAKD